MFAACEPFRAKVELMEEFARVAWSIQAKVEICWSKNPADMLTKGVTIEKLKLCAASSGLLAWGQEDELQGWGIVLWRIVVDVCSLWALKVELMEEFASVAWLIQTKVEICWVGPVCGLNCHKPNFVDQILFGIVTHLLADFDIYIYIYIY